MSLPKELEAALDKAQGVRLTFAIPECMIPEEWAVLIGASTASRPRRFAQKYDRVNTFDLPKLLRRKFKINRASVRRVGEKSRVTFFWDPQNGLPRPDYKQWAPGAQELMVKLCKRGHHFIEVYDDGPTLGLYCKPPALAAA